MKCTHSLVLTGFLCITALTPVPANAQTAGDIKYTIVWHGADHAAVTAAYAVTGQDGTTVEKSLDGELPLELELFAPSAATVTASGTSVSQDVHVIIRIYRDGHLCDETATYGSGNYAIAFCSPPASENR